jgi:hypothetical protein
MGMGGGTVERELLELSGRLDAVHRAAQERLALYLVPHAQQRREHPHVRLVPRADLRHNLPPPRKRMSNNLRNTAPEN